MGLFDWFGKKSKVEVTADRIWLTKQAKFAGICSAIEDARHASDPPHKILLIAHFPDSLDDLTGLLQQPALADQGLVTLMADDLEVPHGSWRDLGESAWVLMIVAERHPLGSHDDALLKFAKALPCRCRVSHYLSLDDPLIQLFSGGWVKQVLGQLGMKEGEAIESRMVVRRIQQQQKRIAQQAIGDRPAKSAEEWLEYNWPNR